MLVVLNFEFLNLNFSFFRLHGVTYEILSENLCSILSEDLKKAINKDLSKKLIYSCLNLLIDMVQDQPKIFAKLCRIETYVDESIFGKKNEKKKVGTQCLLKTMGKLIDVTNPANELHVSNYCIDFPLVYFNLQRLIRTMIDRVDDQLIKDILYYLIFQFGDSRQNDAYRTFRENGYSFWKNICYPMRAGASYLKDYKACKDLFDEYRRENLSGTILYYTILTVLYCKITQKTISI